MRLTSPHIANNLNTDGVQAVKFSGHSATMQTMQTKIKCQFLVGKTAFLILRVFLYLGRYNLPDM